MVDYSQINNGLLPQPGSIGVDNPGLVGASVVNSPVLGLPQAQQQQVQPAAATQAQPLPSDTTDDEVRQRVLANIAKGEAKSYNELVGGGSFNDYSQFPQWSGKQFDTGPSHAAGLYQFQPGTWATAQKALGLTNFSPASQDKAAWWLANKTYGEKTGRDLATDAKAGNVNWGALGSQWSSLANAKPGGVGNTKLPVAGAQQEHGQSGGNSDNSNVVQGNNPNTSHQLSTQQMAMLAALQAFHPNVKFEPISYDPYQIYKLSESSMPSPIQVSGIPKV